ncbi:hypothetical protein GQ600_21423 [Phytophthora cactorum]|nr:hypothetical protein GQ600_21423 [Phytophthora cactorum]
MHSAMQLIRNTWDHASCTRPFRQCVRHLRALRKATISALCLFNQLFAEFLTFHQLQIPYDGSSYFFNSLHEAVQGTAEIHRRHLLLTDKSSNDVLYLN